MTAPTLGVLAPSWSPVSWLVLALVLLVVAAVTVVCVVRARRLDHLHRRTDAARAGLADALERRATVALTIAVADAPADAALRIAAGTALTACRDGMRAAGVGLEPCEAAENALTRRLAAVDRGDLPIATAVELAEAEQLVLLARRVHNDAVRDTLDLRSRRLVRWLRLAGTAAAPAYFEIADPQRHGGTRPRPAGRPEVAGSAAAVPSTAAAPAVGSSVAGSSVPGSSAGSSVTGTGVPG